MDGEELGPEGEPELDQGQELGEPGEDHEIPAEGQPPEDVGEPAEEPWRGAINEAMAGFTTEMRQTLSDFSSDIRGSNNRRFDEMSRSFPRPQPTPKPEGPPQHPWDEDPINLIEAGGDPQLARYFKAQRTQSQATLDQIKELQNRIDESERSSTKRRQGDEMATHFRGQLQGALKSNNLEGDAEDLDPIVQPLMMGLALLAEGGDPRRADVPGAVKGLESYIQKRIKKDRDQRIEAGELQAGKPVPPPAGQGTRPTIQRREVKNIKDFDDSIDDLMARWPEQGPPGK